MDAQMDEWKGEYMQMDDEKMDRQTRVGQWMNKLMHGWTDVYG